MRPFHVRGTDRAVLVVKTNYDGDLFFQGSQDGFINCWVTETGERLGNYKTSGAVKTLDVTHNSEYLVSASLEGSLDIFKVQGGIPIGRIRTTKRKARHIELSFGNQYLLIVYQPMTQMGEYEIKVFKFQDVLKACDGNKDIQMDTLTAVQQWSFSDFKLIQASWGFMNKTIVMASVEGELGLLDFETGKEIKRFKAHQGEIKNFTMAKDFSLMATAANDGCKVLDPATLEVIRYYKYEVPMNAVAISPLLNNDRLSKPHLIVAGGIPARETARTKFQGFDIHICNIIYEEEVGKFLNSNQIGPINSLDFFPDGRGFVTGEEGGYSRIYKFDQSYWENDIFN